MLNTSTRRLLAGLGVVGALVATTAIPASAAPADVEINLYFPDVTVAADTAGKVESPVMSASEPVVLREATMRYDFSDLAGKVNVTEDDDFGYCTKPEPGVLLCTDPFEIGLDEWGLAGLFQVVIAATDGTDDATGKLKVTFSAAGVDPLTWESTVRVGEGVDLAGATDTVKVSARPGEALSLPLTVRNPGTTTVKGSTALFDVDYELRADEKYSNCTYEGDELRFCHFDQELAPGTTYRASVDFVLGKDTYAPGDVYTYTNWMTSAEYEDFAAYLESRGISPGKPGTGPELTLAVDDRARAPQADTDPDNNWSSYEVAVTGTNGTDLAAIGDKLTGAAGDKVTATVGFRNNGPATLNHIRSDSPVTHLRVGVPQGTTVIGAPEWCVPIKGEEFGEPGEAGGSNYHCYASTLSIAGEEETYEFTLRVDKVVANAKGPVEVNVPCQCDGGFYDDLKPANDTAAILVNATGGGGGGGGEDGDGGTLPITGAQTSLIAGVGGLLLAVGVGGFVLARRRRTRFVA
ncbi:LPXTG-motif cell wall anchor domain-containing protein [Micromonospora pallida]|uniref:LPXTG-motif cell wall anchor domain-containing protein n=1 Tax=Micromonospora pallida TaxID=145854 RepID=A0A1C6T9E0_9ACTN|nr:LPXTG cell wall anchor domain-containing protein [Micromonospora pallida]SCL38299.1 LPXTG-motif cell wall anchor domain-containing protein [Micromonospora pallida]